MRTLTSRVPSTGDPCTKHYAGRTGSRGCAPRGPDRSPTRARHLEQARCRAAACPVQTGVDRHGLEARHRQRSVRRGDRCARRRSSARSLDLRRTSPVSSAVALDMSPWFEGELGWCIEAQTEGTFYIFQRRQKSSLLMLQGSSDPQPVRDCLAQHTDRARPCVQVSAWTGCGQRVGLMTGATANQVDSSPLTILLPLPTSLTLEPMLQGELILSLEEGSERARSVVLASNQMIQLTDQSCQYATLTFCISSTNIGCSI